MLAEAGAFDTWLAAYARAQDGGDVALLESLFSEDAKFFETPFHAPIEGRDAIREVFAGIWSRLTGVSFEIGKIADGWAHWTSGAIIEALDEPQRSNGILKAELDDEGRCRSLTFWTERLSVREADMLAQRDA